MSYSRDRRKTTTYADAGVDIEQEGKAIRGLLSSITFRREGIGAPVDLGGHFSGLIDMGDRYLSLCTDGVGSKLRIAEALQKWNTVGIDCMAMNVNDIICIGAEPLAFVDYIAVDEPEEKVLTEIGEGLNEGARQSNLTIIGGETASLPDIVEGLDLAGTCLGMVNKGEVITGSEIKPGDLMIGLPSSGIHSNGFSLVRKVVEDNDISYISPLQEVIAYPAWKNRSLYPEYMKKVEDWVNSSDPTVIGEVLLTPTRIYVREIMELLSGVDRSLIKGMANITGGGIRNLSRMRSDVSYQLQKMPEIPPIFRLIQVLGSIDEKEMYQTFNMGLGMVVVIEASAKENVLDIVSAHGGMIIGEVKKGRGIELVESGISYSGYV